MTVLEWVESWMVAFGLAFGFEPLRLKRSDLRAELAAANTYAKMSADKCLRLRAELAESRNRERALREALTLAQSWAEWAGAHSFETESDNKWREAILGEIEKALRVSGAAAPEDTKEKR